MPPASVLIVGGGVAGLATAWWLARRGGVRVALVERAGGLGRESSGKNAAILRTACADPLERELAARGARFLHAPPAGFAAQPLVARCGLILTAGERGAAELERWIAAVPPDVPVEPLAPDAFRAAAPHYRGALVRAWRFPEEGRLDTAGLVEAYADGARRAGARIETGTAVRELLAEPDAARGVRLADGRTLEADAVVLAAGAWAGALGAGAGSRLALHPTQRHLLVTAPDARVAPGGPVVWGLDDAFYARPEAGGLLLCACDETPADPDVCADDPRALEALRARARALVPAQAALPVARAWHGLRTFTDDRRFAVGWDADVRGLFWVAGLGGAGMVTSPEVGRLAAERLCGGAADDPLARALDPARLTQGALRP